MKNPNLEPKHRQMLDLLADGASTRTIAKKMGYSDGTVRVYLHNLYKKLGVKNRTEALLWQLERRRGLVVMPVAPARTLRANEAFGEVALRDGLLGGLGIMESFIGPYGRVWEIGVQLKGAAPDNEALGARDDARLLWRALLQGAFSHAKAVHEERQAERWFDDATPHAFLVAGMLILGGFTQAGDECLATLSRARKGGRGAAAREIALLRGLREAMYSSGVGGLNALHQVAVEKTANAALRQLAQVLLFHAQRYRKDPDGAREAANAIWWEAESARRQLEAMGVRSLGREADLPKLGKPAPRRAARARVTAGG